MQANSCLVSSLDNLGIEKFFFFTLKTMMFGIVRILEGHWL